MIQGDHSEIWIETKAENGTIYYYNAKTRETSWNKPENAKVFTQEQFLQNALASSTTTITTNGAAKTESGTFALSFAYIQSMTIVLP